MTAKVKVSQVIERPVEDVFRFYAVEHVRNHPRWDPYMQLENISEGPMGVGTTIKRVNSRSGTPVEGKMEVVEFVPDESIGMVIHDGPVELRGRATVEAESDRRSRLTFYLEIPGMDDSTDTSEIISGIQNTLRNIKRLVESDVRDSSR